MRKVFVQMKSDWMEPKRGLALLACMATAGLLLAARAQVVDTNYQCVQYQTAIVNGVRAYVQDWDGHFPPKFATTADLRHYISPYIHTRVSFVCPDTQQSYVPNAALAGKTITSIDLSATPILQDAVAHQDRLLTIAYADGRDLHGGHLIGNIRDLCVENTRAITLAMQQYAQDYDGTLPPTTDYQKFDTVIEPYLRAPWRFNCPDTGRFYRPNPTISGLTLAKIAYPSDTVSVTELAQHEDGFATVAYLDGHALHGAYQSGGTYYGPGTPEQLCIDNVHQVNRALLMYVQDYDEVLPPMHTLPELKSKISPYIKGPGLLQLFTCPATRLPYVPNGALSGKSLAQFADRSTTVTLQDAQPHVDGKSTYGYLDGNVSRH